MHAKIRGLSVKIFADGANLDDMIAMSKLSHIKGLTTNPTLMRKSGILNYEEFAKSVLEQIESKPISFEVFSDDHDEMLAQASKIANWGENVYVKIPVTNSFGVSSLKVIEKLSHKGVKINVTALTTSNQAKEVLQVLSKSVESYISIFAGRIADTGRDPVPILTKTLKLMEEHPHSELIWASPRELLNIFQADSIGCHVITATSDILNKLPLVGKDLLEYSLETVQMFKRDAEASQYRL